NPNACRPSTRALALCRDLPAATTANRATAGHRGGQHRPKPGLIGRLGRYNHGCRRPHRMSGHETAKRLTLWFRQWRVPLRRFLMEQGIVPAADVSDVAQEVFLRLLRYDRAELIEYPQAYLFKMAANVANEWALRARRRHPHESEWLEGLPAEDRPEADIAVAQAQAEVERALY